MSKTIIISNGLHVWVDDEDYAEQSAFKWTAQKEHKTFYATRLKRINGKYKKIYMHRSIMKAPKGMEVDHGNGNGLDNRRENLEIVTHNENMQRARRWRSLITEWAESVLKFGKSGTEIRRP